MPPALRIPALLDALVVAGRWSVRNADGTIPRAPTVAAERIARLAPEETEIHLDPPPFSTLRQHERDQPRYWRSAMLAPDELDFDLAILIGDFGVGSDAPIVLDYRESLIEPRVLRLRWKRPEPNAWVLMAPDFRTFVDVLSL